MFILKNPFTPLLFRSINLALAVAALGISAHIRIQQSRAGVLGVLGSSTLFVICVTPAAILHIFVTLYVSPKWFSSEYDPLTKPSFPDRVLWHAYRPLEDLDQADAYVYRTYLHLPVLGYLVLVVRRLVHVSPGVHSLHSLRSLQ